MIADRMVRVKLKRNYEKQRPFSYVGKVRAVDALGVLLHGRGIMLSRQQPNGVQVTPKPEDVLIPAQNIESIRVLPDAFDIQDIQVTTDNQQLMMVVKGSQDAYIGELGEG
jgi:hypothetical protein